MTQEQIKQLAESIFPFEDYARNPAVNHEYIISKMCEMYSAALTEYKQKAEATTLTVIK